MAENTTIDTEQNIVHENMQCAEFAELIGCISHAI